MVKARKGKKNKGNRNPSPQTREAASKSLLGNRFWEIRSKHGRDKLFATPQLLLEAACEYFNWCDSHPFKETKPMTVSVGNGGGSEIQMVEIPIKRPYTIQGLCGYIDCSTAYFRTAKQGYDPVKDKDFLSVIAKIEETIYNQQFSGASAGFFNANIIARALGLVDKQDVTSGGEKLSAPEFKVYNNAPPMANDEKNVDNKKQNGK